jgi:hypothetical protein
MSYDDPARGPSYRQRRGDTLKKRRMNDDTPVKRRRMNVG